MTGRQRAVGLLVLALAAWQIVGQSFSPGRQEAGPRRIISIVPSVTEILFAIGAGPHVVAVSTYDHTPREVERLPRVGALLDPDVERMLSLRPDLVVTYGSQGDLSKQLARAGIPMFPYRHGDLAQLMRTIRDLGRRVGSPAGAESLANQLERRFAAIRARVQGRPRPRTLLVIEREPLTLRNVHASAGIGFMHEILEIAGAHDALADVRRESLQLSTETILARAPEAIVELHYTGELTGAQLETERNKIGRAHV